MEITVTKDDSNTIFLPEIDEHYHSVNGAIGESEHVYISAGFKACDKKNIKIFEVGFGTGLNALLTYYEAKRKGITVSYKAVELYPINMDIIKSLNYPSLIKSEADASQVFLKLHDVPWNESISISNNFYLVKMNTDIIKGIPFNEFDVVYYDAFAPEKQPEVWNQQIFDEIYKKLNNEGVLVTYCAKGELKRKLKKAGFRIEPLPGFDGKREMTRAWKS